MEIRKAEQRDLSSVMALYAQARAYMKDQGNPNQWGDAYPPLETVEGDLQKGFLYVCEENGSLLGVFSWIPGPDPTYGVIEQGSWHREGSYTVIHRVAVGVHHRGVASQCLRYAIERCRNLRIDTHRDNLPMQRTLEKNGFRFCGIIHLADGSERLAYDRTDL